MKYEILLREDGSKAIDKHAETDADIDGNYSVKITIGVHPTDGKAKNYSEDITVISNNSQTGIEVDLQRQQAIDNFLIQFNS